MFAGPESGDEVKSVVKHSKVQNLAVKTALYDSE
jgi:hypothetical protein